MQLGQSQALDDYYLWKKGTGKHPWQRQYLNTEFYKHERKRIVEYKIGIKKPKG